MKLTVAQSEAVVRLRNNSDFKVLTEALDAYRHDLVDMTMNCPEDKVLTCRGMLKSVTKVLHELGKAESYVRGEKR